MDHHYRPLVLALTILLAVASPSVAQESSGEIRLIVRSDDMGAAHAVNVACLDSVVNGIARSIEVLVPSPWFIEAAEMLQAHPDIDVGVHLDLTSEWTAVKWGPVSKSVPSLVDANGHFFPTTRQRQSYPPNTGFLESGWKIEEAERELRAQIEMALRLLPKVTHLSAHMGTATSTPELQAMVAHLAESYGLPITIDNMRRTGNFGGHQTTPQEKEERMIQILENLTPGLWMFVEHPGQDTPEMRAIGHPGYENVAADRAGVTHALTSERVKAVVQRRGIKLVSYADVLEERGLSKKKAAPRPEANSQPESDDATFLGDDPTNGWVEIGRSVEDRPIYRADFGSGEDVTLIFGCFHGNERTTPFLVLRLAEYLQANPSSFSAGKQVVLVPFLNPDGYVKNTRRNANDVDLNRNYPTQNWGKQPQGKRRVYFGPAAASEPETKIVLQLLEELQPDKIVTIHQPLECNNNDGPAGLRLAQIMSALNGYPVKPYIGYPTPGSFGTYAGQEHEIPMVTLELPPAKPALADLDDVWEGNRDALLAVINYEAE